jgi:GNAT superfamily N-acetyltransferase
MLFASTQLVMRIEQAEARSLTAIVAVCAGHTFAVPVGTGFALFNGADSPLSKLVGLGFEPLEASALGELEQRYHARGAPAQIELSTHADPAITNQLAGRGYRFTGFENVLGCRLDPRGEWLGSHKPPEHEVRRARSAELAHWIDVMTTGASQLAGDEQPAAHDSFDRRALERAFHDMARSSDVDCWLAFRGSEVAGGAAMAVRDGVTQLFGAATHPAHRRRGVQRALLAARLAAGAESGCDVAVVTTQPGSQSQHNVQRCGFSPLYARAVWLLHPS